MTLEETIAQAVTAAVAPLTAEVRRLVTELDQLRRALPAQLVTVPVAAEHLGISQATVRRRIKDGSIPVRRVGALIRIDLAAIQCGPSDAEVARLAAGL